MVHGVKPQHGAAAIELAAEMGVELPPDLASEVMEQESTGFTAPRFTLSALINATRTAFSEAGMRGDELDMSLVRIFVPILSGLIHQHRIKKLVRAYIRSTEKVSIGKYRFIITEGEIHPMVSIVGRELFYTGLIYSSKFNLGVTRFPGLNKPDLTRLEAHLPGWFIHPAGFLACWGSRKAPAKGPPPEGTPQSINELVKLMREVFADDDS